MPVPPDDTPKPQSPELKAKDHGASYLGLGLAPFLAVVAVALAVRLLHVYQTRQVPFVQQLVGDAAGYWTWARQIAAGDWLGTEAFYQAPLYPYVLGVLFRLFGESVDAVRMMQAVFGAAACGLMALAAARWFGRWAGVAAGLMLALYPPAIFFDGIIQKASLGGLLTSGLLASAAGVQARTSPARLVLLGLTAGLLALTRENALAWLPVIGVWLLWLPIRGQHQTSDNVVAQPAALCTPAPGRWARLAWFGGGAALVLAPVLARNLHVADTWSLSTYQFGPNFYIGNGAEADGRYRPLVPGHETPMFERRDATVLAEQAVGQTLSPREVSRFWTRRTIQDIESAPGRWLRLLIVKLLMTVNRYEVADVEGMAAYRAASTALALQPLWHLGVLAPVSVAGMVLTWGRRREYLLLYALLTVMWLAVAAFFILARYRHPVVLLLVPFAAAGVVEAVRAVRGRRFAPLAAATIVAGVVALIVNWPVHPERQLEAQAHMNLGVALAQQERLGAARTAFEAALGESPQSAEGHFNLAQTLRLLDDHAGAVREFEAALSCNPNLVEAHFFLATLLEERGESMRAAEHYRQVLRVNPGDAEAAAGLRRVEGRAAPEGSR